MSDQQEDNEPKGVAVRIERGLLAVVVVAAVVALAGSPGLSQQGRDFSGYYDLTDVVDLGDDVALTFTVEVFNHGAIDAFDATVTLEDPLDPEASYGSLWVGFIGAGTSVSASDLATVPAWEYASWQEGASPRLRIDFSDAGGGARRSTVELIGMLPRDGEA